MLPYPDAFKRGCASWLRWKADSKLVAIINETSSAVKSVASLTNTVPALFTWTKIRELYFVHTAVCINYLMTQGLDGVLQRRVKTYKDIELSIKDRRHSLHQFHSLASICDITDWSSDIKSLAFPFLQTLIKLSLFPRTSVDCCSKFCQFFYYTMPDIRCPLALEKSSKLFTTGNENWRKRKYPMPLVPPVTRAVIPLRDHLWSPILIEFAAMASISSKHPAVLGNNWD